MQDTLTVVSVPTVATAGIGPTEPPVTVKPAVAVQDTEVCSGPAPPPTAPPLMSTATLVEPGTEAPIAAPAAKVMVVPPAGV